MALIRVLHWTLISILRLQLPQGKSPIERDTCVKLPVNILLFYCQFDKNVKKKDIYIENLQLKPVPYGCPFCSDTINRTTAP